MIVTTLISCLVMLAAAESLIFFLESPLGILLYIILLIGLFVRWLTAANDAAMRRLTLALTLVPVCRLVSLFSSMVMWALGIDADIALSALTQALLLLTAIGFLRITRFRRIEVGLVLDKLRLQLAAGLTGFGIGSALYFALRPDLNVPDSSWYWLLFGALVVAVGAAAEEFIFRGLLQRGVTPAIGSGPGLCYVSLVFAVAHLGNVSGPNLSILSIPLIFVAAIFYGFMVLKTGSLLGATISHTIANITIFMVLPLVI